jgi:anti-anti-sigma factor
MPPQAVCLTTFRISHKTFDGQSGQAVAKRLRRHANERVRLDFRHVEQVTASGLGQLVEFHKQLRAIGGRLTLVNVRAMPYEVFEVTHLTRVLDVRRPYRGTPDA